MSKLNPSAKRFIVLFALIFIFWIFFFAKTDFYEAHGISDLYAIPLYKPYRLFSVSDDSVSLPSWNLDFKYSKTNKSGAKNLNVTDVNVAKVIYGHGQRTMYEPNDWFVIIPDKKIEKTFKNENDWKSYLKQAGIDSVNLFPVWPLFYEFQKKSTLPWYNKSKEIMP